MRPFLSDSMNKIQMKFSKLIAFLLLAIVCRSAAADCYDDAASYHSVNPIILRAIVFQESKFNPLTVNQNTNRSTDIGLAGTNSVHFDELAKFGVSPSDLFVPCKSIYVGAWMLSKKIRRHGNSWIAIGAYHSETPHLRDIYALKIRNIVEGWIEKGHYSK